MRRAIEKVVAPLKRRVLLMVGRAVLAAVNDGGKRQYIQFKALEGEVKDGVERMQQYGFTSHPLPGAQVLFVSLGGNRDHPVAISVDDSRYRLKELEPGEVALYTDEGDQIVLKRGNTIEVTTQTLLVKASSKARFETPQLECTGEIIDRVDDDGMTMHGMRDVYNEHVHPENDSGGPTDPPNQHMVGV